MLILRKTKPIVRLCAKFSKDPPIAVGIKLNCYFCGTKVKITDESDVKKKFIEHRKVEEGISGHSWRRGNTIYNTNLSCWYVSCICPNCGCLMSRKTDAKFEWVEEYQK